MSSANKHAAVMDLSMHPDDSTICGKCGVNTMLVEAHADYNEEECLHCGQHYRVYEE